MKNLATLEIVEQNEKGITHVELVKKLLENGYKHSGNLSKDLMTVVHNLSEKGVIEKNLETRTIKPMIAQHAS